MNKANSSPGNEVFSVTLSMAKAKKTTKKSTTYLTKRRLASAARLGIQVAAANTMKVMGYTIVAHGGWVVKKYPDGTIENIEPLANHQENANISHD